MESTIILQKYKESKFKNKVKCHALETNQLLPRRACYLRSGYEIGLTVGLKPLQAQTWTCVAFPHSKPCKFDWP